MRKRSGAGVNRLMKSTPGSDTIRIFFFTTALFNFRTQCQTARYRGAVVRIKELRFDRKKDIPRDLMKEMKIMRELRHDNINR